MDFLNILRDFFLSVFTIDISVYIISAWAVVALFFIVLNVFSGRKVVRK